MKKVLLDSDVILDTLLARTPHLEHSEKVLVLAENGLVKAHTTAVVLSNVLYMLGGHISPTQADRTLISLTSYTRVIPITHANAEKALLSSMNDTEDAFQAFAAQTKNIDAIITRNVKDYKHSPVPAMTPEMFIATL